MRVIWSPEASRDLDRLYNFLARVAPEAAEKMLISLAHAPERLTGLPRIGPRLDGFNPREVRKLGVGKYELRYEMLQDAIYIIRVFHVREDRSFEDG